MRICVYCTILLRNADRYVLSSSAFSTSASWYYVVEFRILSRAGGEGVGRRAMEDFDGTFLNSARY